MSWYKKETKGSEVREYKGVNIFITTDGTFFCDCINNSNILENKTFNSNKLTSIIKAIDSFKGNEINETFYKLNHYPVKIEKFKATSKVGNRLLFDDGTDSESYSKRGLYKKTISKKEEFKKLLLLEKEEQRIYKEKAILEKELKKIRDEAKYLISKIN